MEHHVVLPKTVVKRDGQTEVFESDKIMVAIAKAGKATGEFDAVKASELMPEVLTRISTRFANAAPGIEDIQDIVEQVLLDSGFLSRHVSILYIASSMLVCGRIGRRLSMWNRQSTNIYSSLTGGSMLMPIKVIVLAV